MRLMTAVAVVLLGCRENQEGPLCLDEMEFPAGEEEAAGDGGREVRTEPECDSGYATGVIIAAAPENRRLELAKRDETMDESARLSALAWHEDEGGDPVESFVRFEWEIADESVAFLLPYGVYGQGAMVWARQDRFDADGGRDPETSATVCAVNDCRQACGPCQERVCAEPLIVAGLPNLEGRWQIVADTLPVPVAVDVLQDGGRLVTAVADAEATVSGGGVRFVFDGQVYSGTLAPTRDLVDGLVSRIDDDSSHLIWSAVRLSD